MLRSRGILDADLSPVPELTEIYLRLGRGPEAAKIAGEFENEADAKAQPWALARAARCRALLADVGQSDDHFETALALHGQTADAFETGRTQLAMVPACGVSVSGSAPASSFAPLDVFDHLGAQPWSEMARAELAATGETARRREVATLNDLTPPQELQIALSLAEGCTTRETAAALFLSPKTIEYHLRNVYRKLSIGSRSELKAAMTGLGSSRLRHRPDARRRCRAVTVATPAGSSTRTARLLGSPARVPLAGGSVLPRPSGRW